MWTVCRRCGQVIRYYEDAYNEVGNEIFDIPKPYTPNRAELENDPAFCHYCGESRRLSLIANSPQQFPEIQFEEKITKQVAYLLAFYLDYSHVIEVEEAWCLLLDVMRQRFEGDLPNSVKSFMSEEAQRATELRDGIESLRSMLKNRYNIIV